MSENTFYSGVNNENSTYASSEYSISAFDSFRIRYDERAPEMLHISVAPAMDLPNVLTEEESLALDKMLEKRDDIFRASFNKLAEIGKKIEYR